MPLYEMVLVTKCTAPSVTADIMKNIGMKVCAEGGVVREVRILSDRLLPKEMQTINGQSIIIGRFAQVLFDGSPRLVVKAVKEAKIDVNVAKVTVFKIQDFYNYVQEYNKKVNAHINNRDLKAQTASKIALLREQS